jgi:hypothetical protein
MVGLPAAEALQVPDSGDDAVFGVGEPPLNGSPKKRHLFAQCLCTLRRHDLHKMFEHHLKPPRHLGAIGPVEPDLRHGESDEVLPARRPVHEPYLSGGISRNTRIELSLTEQVQEVMELVNGQNPRGGIIYSRGEGLAGDVHEDAEAEGRVVLQNPLGTQGDAAAQAAIIYGACAGTVQTKNVFSGGQKIAHLRDEFDRTVRPFGYLGQANSIKRECSPLLVENGLG